MRRLRSLGLDVLTCTLLVLGLTAGASAQSFQGGLRGAVKDANGVIPGVEVTITNEATNVARSTITNETGEYGFAAVTPGVYSVKAVLQGFKTFERKGLTIGTQQFITLDLPMEVGTISEEISVTAAAPLIETSNASTGQVLDRAALETLPAPGRNAFMVAVSVPTVITSGDAQFNRQQDQTNSSLVSLGGGPRRGNNYLLDGVPITDMTNRPSAFPSIEAIDEIKVQVNTYDAEMGRTGGGVFNTTGKSGSNDFHGSGFFQNRPVWGQWNNWFNEKQGIAKPTDLYYWLYGGSFGGPVVKDRTFFWTSTEGYRSRTSRNGQLIMPTTRERNGDFSQTFDNQGRLVTIYDPLTTRANPAGGFIRDPFPGNVIPANRLSAVGKKMVGFFPVPDNETSGANGVSNFNRTAGIVDEADQFTAKTEHKFSDRLSLTGMYLYNHTNEPGARYWEATNPFADPGQGILQRRVHLVALNNIFIPNPSTVLSLRYGMTKFTDNSIPLEPFDISTLGFPTALTNDIQFSKYPRGRVDGYGEIGNATTFGDRDPNYKEWYSWGMNGSVSKFVGKHTLKMGADFRRIGLDSERSDLASGDLRFDKLFTQGPNPNVASLNAGNGIASMLLGYPSPNPNNVSSFALNTPLQIFLNYYAGYIQDDFRASAKLTLNFGLRYEFESGLQEQEDRFTVAFDQAAVNPLAAQTGLNLKGGLRYAGQDGFSSQQGDPSKAKLSPRAGLAWTVNDKTVVRGGYGIFWAPWNYPSPTIVNYGNIGYSQDTQFVTDSLVPSGTLDTLFPTGLVQPAGNSRGLLTGVGRQIEYVAQDRQSPRVQQYSIDLQREMPGNIALSIGYTGSRGDHLPVGGTVDSTININQLDPQYLALGSALQTQVPNPFFGIADAGNFSRTATIAQGQLLRPYPQFGNILEHQTSDGYSRYHAFIAKVERRMTGGFGGRVSYTYSRLQDNQFGETNFYSTVAPGLAQNNYDLDAEFSHGILDVPHRWVFTPTWELPFGEGHKWMTGGLGNTILGGWNISAIATMESGFPLNISQNNENTGSLGGSQRPNIVSGVDPRTDGDTYDRLNGWVDPTAFTEALPFTYGNAPRTDTRVRTPFRNNLDLVLAKSTPIFGVKAQIRAELINATNTPKFVGFEQRFGNSAFGRITRQGGFSRVAQFTLRLFW